MDTDPYKDVAETKQLLFFLIIVFSLVSGYFLSVILWNSISLPFSNPYNVVGKLTIVNFNPLVNCIRWGIFVLMPSIIFSLLLFLPVLKNIILGVFTKNTSDYCARFFERPSNCLGGKTIIFFVLILLFIVPCIVFIQKDFTTEYFDVFHEGVELTPAINFINGKGVWTGTLFVRGAFNDLFTAVLGWKLFGVISIGAYRVVVDLLKLLIPLTLAALLYAIWKCVKNKFLASLVIQSTLFFYLYSQRIQNFDRRDAPLLLGMAVLILAATLKPGILYFIAGLFSALCSFYSLDIGIYFTVLLLIFFPLALLLKVYKPGQLAKALIISFFGVLFGWLIFYLTLGSLEFSAFLNNFLYILHAKDLLDSYIYPFPSLISSFRFTLPMIISGFNILIYIILMYFIYLKKDLKTEGLVHGLLTVISLLHYRSALGRSDMTHIEYSSSLIIMVFGINIILLIIFFNLLKKKLNYLVVFLVILNCSYIILPAIKTFNPSNIFTFGFRLNVFVHKDDDAFINKDRIGGISRLKQIFGGEECVFSLTSDAFTPYLVKKPSCGPVYITYFASVDPVRSSFLNELKTKNPKYILYSSKLWTQSLDRITNNQRLSELMKYVDSKYSHYEMVADYWDVYKRN